MGTLLKNFHYTKNGGSGGSNNTLQLPLGDALLNEIYLTQATERRTIEFIEEFDREGCYKAIYFLNRIERLDDADDIPMKDREPIVININSYGGVIYHFMAMASAITRLQKRGYIIKTSCVGVAMSCGFMLLILGNKGHRTIGAYNTAMCHQHSGGMMGCYQEMIEDMDEQHKLWKTMCDIITDKTNITKEQLEDMRDRKLDWYMNAEDCVKLGVVDFIK